MNESWNACDTHQVLSCSSPSDGLATVPTLEISKQICKSWKYLKLSRGSTFCSSVNTNHPLHMYSRGSHSNKMFECEIIRRSPLDNRECRSRSPESKHVTPVDFLSDWSHCWVMEWVRATAIPKQHRQDQLADAGQSDPLYRPLKVNILSLQSAR